MRKHRPQRSGAVQLTGEQPLSNKETEILQVSEEPPAASIWHEPMQQEWSCFPLPLRSKEAKAKWKRWQTERPNEAKIKAWASQDTNVAIVTGKISNLVVPASRKYTTRVYISILMIMLDAFHYP